MTISSSIELYDNFSGVFTSITSAMNLMLSGINDIQSAMDSGVNTNSFDAARADIQEAEAALASFQEQIESLRNESQNIPPVEVPSPEIPPVEIPPVEVPPTEIPPVSIPVEYDFTNTEAPVFTSTGIERYNQEIANANTLMDQLLSTQASINSNAADILDPTEISSLNDVNNRLSLIQQRIQQIENNPMNVGTDSANNGLEQLRNQMARALQEQQQLNNAIENMDPSAANAAYARLSATIDNTERYIRDNVSEQGRFNSAIGQGADQANNLTNKIKSAVAAYISIRGIGEALDLSDEITQTQSRLNMMLDNFNETGSVDDLFNKVYASAQDARGSLTETAAVIARFGNNAKDAFSSTDEVVEFANLIQKQMTVAGASTSEAANAMLQLSQGLGSGVLRGDELNSIFENAPNLIQNIADYLNVPIGQIRDMASEGELTADVVKNAIFAASDEINEKFEEMPMTWGQIWTSFKNTAIMAFEPVLARLNDLANSNEFQSFINSALSALATLSNIVISVLGAIASIGSFMADNWSIISPIIYGVIAALTLFNIAQGISNFLAGEGAIAMAWKAICDWAETAALIAMTIAQDGLNAALAACPITWIIIAIIALIAIIFAVCAAIAKFTGVANSAFGVICGTVATVAAFIWNIIVAVINGIIQLIWSLFVEPFLGIIEWILNVCQGGFDSFGDAVANLIGQIISWFLSLGKVVTKIIDAIFGTDWTSKLSALQNEVISWGKSEGSFSFDEEVHEAPALQRIEYGNAWSAGAEFGDGISSSFSSGLDDLSDFSNSAGSSSAGILNSEGVLNGDDVLNGYDRDIANSSAETADNTKKTAEALKKSEDILDMIKDSVSRERIANYTTKQITVDMSGMSNSIASSMSISDVVKSLEKEIARAASAAVEGV